jgi:hypothetical protein
VLFGAHKPFCILSATFFRFRPSEQIYLAVPFIFKQSTTQIRLFAAGATVLLLVGAGCKREAGDKKPGTPSPSPSTKASPSGLPVEAQLGNLELTMLDEKGRTIVEVKAKAGAVGPGRPGADMGSAVGSLSGGTAILHQEGKPAAKLTADSLRADQETRTVTAKGNATVTSLADSSAPAIRADTMIWRYETGTIKGNGNVLVTRKPDLRVPGTSFTADTRLQTFTLSGGAGPVSGTF